MRMILLSGSPAIFFQRSKAWSSSIYTVAVSRSAGSPNSFVIRFHASSIARSLK